VRANRIFLILTLVCAMFGFTAGDSMYLELGRPFAGIFFGLFLITTVLQKESDLLDEQLGLAKTAEPEPPTEKSESDADVPTDPELSHA
jgi:hypothetical protein